MKTDEEIQKLTLNLLIDGEDFDPPEIFGFVEGYKVAAQEAEQKAILFGEHLRENYARDWSTEKWCSSKGNFSTKQIWDEFNKKS